MSDLGTRAAARWYLEGLLEGGKRTWRTEVRPLPFVIGRLEECDLRLHGAGVSGRHAEIVAEEGGIAVRDLTSKNGTFVNLDRVEADQPLRHGDLLHIANQELRVVLAEADTATATVALDLSRLDVERAQTQRRADFDGMLRSGRLRNDYQPVVDLRSGDVFGFEALGRGADPALPQSPEELFSVAEGYGLETDLCETLRLAVCDEIAALPAGCDLFLNTHPRELDDARRLISSLAELRRRLPGVGLALELHEMAVTDVDTLRPIRQSLRDLDVRLAFDDFGKGRDRFLELAELTPNFLKFDRQLISGLDEGKESEIRRRMVRTIVEMVRDLGVATIAEGIETEEAAAACRMLGFDYGQGYYWGQPAPAEAWRG